MRYTVTWHAIALNELANIWLSAIEKQAVTRAADKIDSLLRINPEVIGLEHLGDRLLAINPLMVTFSVKPGDRTVTILRVERDSTSN